MKHSRGFSLLELLIVVGTISILAAVSVPVFFSFAVKAKRAEAYLGLKTLHTAQIAFQTEEDYFTTSMQLLGVKLQGTPNVSNLYCVEGASVICGRFYAFWVSDASVDTFFAIARGKPDANSPFDEFAVTYP